MNEKIKNLVVIEKQELKDMIKHTIQEILETQKKEPKQEEEMMDIEAAAAFLGLAKNTLYAHTSQSKIPHYKLGKKLIFKRQELLEWIHEGRRKTARELSNLAKDY